MQILHYTVGPWRAEAQLKELESGKLLAVIAVSSDTDAPGGDSRHTVVFERVAGRDDAQQTEELVRRLLQVRYRM